MLFPFWRPPAFTALKGGFAGQLCHFLDRDCFQQQKSQWCRESPLTTTVQQREGRISKQETQKETNPFFLLLFPAGESTQAALRNSGEGFQNLLTGVLKNLDVTNGINGKVTISPTCLEASR